MCILENAKFQNFPGDRVRTLLNFSNSITLHDLFHDFYVFSMNNSFHFRLTTSCFDSYELYLTIEMDNYARFRVIFERIYLHKTLTF